MTHSSCLPDQQDLFWGNKSRETSEEPQEPQVTLCLAARHLKFKFEFSSSS